MKGIEQTELENPDKRKEYKSQTASGESTLNTYTYDAASFKLDQKIFNDISVEVLINDIEKFQQAKENTGLIGNKFLKDFIVTIDWNDSVIYLFPNG